VDRDLLYLLTPWSRALLETPTSPQLVKKFPTFDGNSPHLMEIEGSLPHLKKPTTLSHPEPDRSNLWVLTP
jgi:hypothetical protein